MDLCLLAKIVMFILCYMWQLLYNPLAVLLFEHAFKVEIFSYVNGALILLNS